MSLNHVILLGGGYSLKQGLALGLVDFIKDKFTIGINYSYKFINSTCNLGVDETLYNNEIAHKEISRLPLWIGKDHRDLKHRELNSIFVTPSKRYDRNLVGGVYKSSLSGIFALSLSIKLLDILIQGATLDPIGDNKTNIYLCGYDYGPATVNGKILFDAQGKPLTHYYQEEFKHRGTGKISWYQQTTLDMETRKRVTRAYQEFLPFAEEKKIKIYNVGGTSNIPHFEQISYETFFTKKLIAVNNQANLRTQIKEVLWQIKREQNI